MGARHRPECRRSGPRRLLHLVRQHLGDTIEESLHRLRVPILVVRGRSDRISSARWAEHLATMSHHGEYIQVRGAHSFPWLDPEAWSEPVHRLAIRAGRS